jgi:prefoldin subunit 5
MVGWVNNVTPLNAANLNQMDNAIKAAHDQLESLGEMEAQFQEIKDSVNELKQNSGIQAYFNSTTGALQITTA